MDRLITKAFKKAQKPEDHLCYNYSNQKQRSTLCCQRKRVPPD